MSHWVSTHSDRSVRSGWQEDGKNSTSFKYFHKWDVADCSLSHFCTRRRNTGLGTIARQICEAENLLIG